jgi:cytochrome c553
VKNVICILLFALLHTFAAAQEKPDWAFPVAGDNQPPVNDDPDKVWTAPGSSLALTRAQINDRYNAPDWYPDMYPPMPAIVKHGNQETEVRACGTCHFPTGTGLDENAYIAGLPVDYFIRQMADYRNGNRKGSGSMTAIAKAISYEEIRSAAEYFASLEPRTVLRVVETDTVPVTYVGSGNKTLRHPRGGTEPIGNRIVQVIEDEDLALNRDPRSFSIAYVPRGSIEKGKELVTTGGMGKTVACAYCHGAALKGSGDVPPLAGRHPNYTVRQLWNIKHGERTGKYNAVMLPIVRELTIDDMLAIAAYAASLEP